MQHRIVSLLPSTTEIVCELGKARELVGISHECDSPSEIRSLPRLTTPRLDPQTSGSAKKQDPVEIVRKALSIYNVDLNLLKSLKPTLIITQDQCHVPGISLQELKEASAQCLHPYTEVLSINPRSLIDIFNSILEIGSLIDAASKARLIVQSLNQTLDYLKKKTYSSYPRVVCLEWLEPPMAAGGWIPELVRLAGGRPILASEEVTFQPVSWKIIRKELPDVLCLFPNGSSLKQTLYELKERSIANPIKALLKLNTKIITYDGNEYLNRPSHRILESAGLLAATFHSDEEESERLKHSHAFHVIK